jgi:acyl dehydratase
LTAEAGTDRSLSFEDYRVGQRFASSTRTVTEADLEAFIDVSGDGSPIHADPEHARSLGFSGPILHGPFGIAVVFGFLHEMGIVERTVIGMLDLDWRFTAPILVGDSLSMEMTITRCRRSSKREAGVVRRYFKLLNQDGATVGEGTSAVLVTSREGAEAVEAHTLTDFASPAWAAEMVPRLEASEEFRGTTSTFDGSIELICGEQSVQLRVYKGRLLEVGRSMPMGPTFSIAGTELAWVDLAFAPRNDYVSRAMRGAFTARGNMFEYVRMTKAVVTLWDCIRAAAGGAS